MSDPAAVVEPDRERSICFGVEELVVLARLTGTAVPFLGPNPLAHVRLAERPAVLDTALRSLRARGAVVGTAAEPAVPTVVRGLLDIVGGAALVARLHVAGPAPLDLRCFAVPYASVEHREEDGLHRLTPFATEDLLARIARTAPLVRRRRPDAEAFTVPYQALHRARVAAAAGDRAAAVRALRDEKVADIDADAFADALVAGGSTVAVRVTHRTGPTTLAGGELAWLDAGPAGLWQVPTIDQPFADLGLPSPPSSGGVPDDHPGDQLDPGLDPSLAAVPVTVGPVDAEAIAAELFSFLPEVA